MSDEPLATIDRIRLEANQTDESSQPERFALTWANRVYEASTPLEFLIDGLITKGSVNLLVGEGGSKKTWAALDLAVCVATGEKWLDLQTKQTAVLLIDEESGPRRLQRRLYETLNGHLVKREDAPQIAFISLAMMNLREVDDVNALHVLIEQTRAGLVIVDALADIMPNADENSVKDVQPVFKQLRSVAENTQTAILVIHHSNKANGDYRGSTAIKGAVDLMLMLESPADSKYLTFKVDKARDIEPKAFTALATWQAETEQFYLTACDVENKIHFSKSQRYVLRYLLENGNSAMDDIKNNADTCEPRTAKDAVYNLVPKYVKRTDAGGRGIKAEYDLTDEGRKLAEVER